MHEVPGWVTVNAWPAIVSVPVLVDVVVLAAAWKLTVPPPDPLAPAVIVIQGTPLSEVHAQPAAVVTLAVPVPPVLATLVEEGEIP